MKDMKYTYYVTCYHCDRAYGGGEEGGWWYDYGVPMIPEYADIHTEPYTARVYTFPSEDKAHSFRERMQFKLDHFINQHRRPISSVLSEGAIYAEVTSHLPKPYPERKPHYE